MKTTKRPRPYRRCQGCGLDFRAARTRPFCQDCLDGQTHLFTRPLAPEGFEPVISRAIEPNTLAEKERLDFALS